LRSYKRLSNKIELYEGDVHLSPPRIVAVRVSLPSDRSFAGYEEAVAHLTACAVVVIAARPLLGRAQEIASYTVVVQQDRGRPASPLERHVTVHLREVPLGQALRTQHG